MWFAHRWTGSGTCYRLLLRHISPELPCHDKIDAQGRFCYPWASCAKSIRCVPRFWVFFFAQHQCLLLDLGSELFETLALHGVLEADSHWKNWETIWKSDLCTANIFAFGYLMRQVAWFQLIQKYWGIAGAGLRFQCIWYLAYYCCRNVIFFRVGSQQSFPYA